MCTEHLISIDIEMKNKLYTPCCLFYLPIAEGDLTVTKLALKHHIF